MKITLVAAINHGDNGIGSRGRLPWSLPVDLRRFRRITMGKDCVVGYRTFIGMPYLDGRNTYVLHRDNLESTATLQEFLRQRNLDDVMVIGGARVYELAMPIATHMELTRVSAGLPPATCDVFFPEIHWDEWRMTSQEFPEDDGRLAFWSMERKEPCRYD